MTTVNAQITGVSTGMNTANSLTALATAMELSQNKQAIVNIILGQSNGRGASDNADIAPELNTTFSDVLIFNGNAFVPLQLSTNQSDSGKHGFEMKLASLIEADGRKAYFIKRCLGGSSLDYNGGSNDWLPYKGVNTKSAIEDYIIKAIGLVEEDCAVNLIWCQGEADSNGGNKGFAERYERNLLALLGQLNRVVAINRTIIIQTNANIAPGTFTKLSTVRAAQQSVASQIHNAKLLSFDSEDLQPDVLHYTADAYANIATAIYPELRWYDSPIMIADIGYTERGIIDFRQESLGASALVTGITTTSEDVVNATALGKALQLTGTSTNGTASIALAEVLNFSGNHVEYDQELVSGGSGIGGVIFGGVDEGGVKCGWLIRLTAGDLKLFKRTASTISLVKTETRTFPTNANLGFRVRHNGHTLNIQYKADGKPWEHLLSYDDAEYSAGKLYLTSGWGGSDETAVLYGNIRNLV